MKKTNLITETQDEIIGCIMGHRDGHGFVLRDDGGADIYLPINEMRAVLHKDKVKVRISKSDRSGRLEGRVLEILERSPAPIIGRLLQENGMWLVAPEDKRYGQDIAINKKELGGASKGQVVAVELIGPPVIYGQPVGRVREILGEMDDPGMEIEIAVRKYGVPHEFSNTCLAQVQALPDAVRLEDTQNRVDLTDIPLVTIDGEDARDFDDAVYCEPILNAKGKEDGRYRLLVAIADVSYYVENGSAVDVDAYDRATSVYFPRRVIPMLPEKLSNGLCSLNPDVQRLCMVCDMVIDAGGMVEAYQFYPAVMFSQARFTYTEVAEILSNTKGPEAKKRQALVPSLLNLYNVYQTLLKARKQRGAMDLETVETQIVCDDNGRIEKIVPRVRNDAHRLIEEAMLAANVCSANFIEHNKHLGLFRVHEGPTPEKRGVLLDYLRSMGVSATLPDEPQPGDFQKIAESTKDRPDAQQIHTMLLRSMQQAIYSPDNSGHFGLAFNAYTHFTSPIRRYPDLLVHRVIKAILANKKYHLPPLPTPGEAHANLSRRLERAKLAKQKHQNAKAQGDEPIQSNAPCVSAEHLAWQAAGLHCSANERRADEASRDVESWLKCKFMHAHLGEEYSGVVSSATSFGLFVTLDEVYIEGLIHISELGSEYFQFDEMRQELRGERSGKRYGIGSKVRIQVSRADMDARRIDFRLLDERGVAVARASHSKSKNMGSDKSHKEAKKDDRLKEIDGDNGLLFVKAEKSSGKKSKKELKNDNKKELEGKVTGAKKSPSRGAKSAKSTKSAKVSKTSKANKKGKNSKAD